jgi:hypothetical protein
MAEVTLAALRDADLGRPSFVPGTEVASFVRFIDVRGPYKVETLYFQQGVDDDFQAADDTVSSILAHPMFAVVSGAGIDEQEATGDFSVTLNSLESDADFKQLVLHGAEDVNGQGVVITVYGF